MSYFLRPNIGYRISRVRAVASQVAVLNRSVIGIWGFGSYFRGGPFRDIDLLVCLQTTNSALLVDANRVKLVIQDRFIRLGLSVDVLVFRPKEVRERPLRDMSDLIPLYCRGCQSSTALRRLGI